MKKLISILSTVVACAASADYIYWFVENPTEVDGKETTWTSAAFFQDSTKLVTVDAENMADFGYSVATLNGGYNLATFFIELYNDSSSTPIAKATVPYSTLAGSIFTDNGIGSPGANKFNASTGATFNVPEPTSGLLFLVGGMLLGLRRKRRV